MKSKVNPITKFSGVIISILVVVFLGSCRRFEDKTTLSVLRETITTYPFSDPDPIPVFARSSIWGPGSRRYPYFVFNGFSSQSRPQEWTVVRLKNKHLEVSILPEVGGKVWGAKDLLTGKEFLYTNQVLKFREIALRGPWTSGGLEFNFGIIGHSPSTATPVDYLTKKNPDGSVSCIVGNYDWPSRSRWQVTITVYPDKGYFKTSSRWTNSSPYRQSYYVWMNAAITVSDDLKFIFPGKYQIGHDYSVPLEPWPVDQRGRDLSWYSNNAFPGSKSYFVVGSYEDFYGSYYQNSDSGFGHWALYSDMPGKKIWIWDLSRAGEIWIDLLTDSDGQYAEPQAGRLLNQSDHGVFRPAASDSWEELWFPYSEIGEMTGAIPQAVLSLTQKDGFCELGIYALERLDESLTVRESEKEILSQRLRLRPGQKVKYRLEPISDSSKLAVYLGQKIIYQADPRAKSLERPFSFRLQQGDSAEALYLAGEKLENEREFQAALEKYLKVVQKSPEHVRALSRIAEIYCRRGEYFKALDYARKALEISRYDPEACYVYGLIANQLDQMADAKETLGWATRSPAYALTAYLRLAEIALKEKDFDRAEVYATRASNYDRENPLPLELLAVIKRRQNRKQEARKISQEVLRLEPLNHLAHYELYLLEPSNKNLKAFKSLIKNEFPEESYLEIALFYRKIGDHEKAIALLEMAPEDPVILTWLSYLYQKIDSEKSRSFLEKAASVSPYLVFPFREESIPVFIWAQEQKPDCWKFRYYLGLIYWYKGRIQDARQIFTTLDSADYYPVFIARAYLNSENTKATHEDLKRAQKLSPEAWRTWHHLISHELNQGLNISALQRSLQALEKFPDNLFISSDAIKSLMANNDYHRAAELLDRMEVLPYEGASEIHSLFVRTHLHLALEYMKKREWSDALKEIARSRDFPERLGTGRPFDPDQRIQDYLEAICQEAMGHHEQARQKYADILSYTEKYPEGPYAYFAALALEKAGLNERAAQIKDRAKPPGEFLDKIKEIVIRN